MLTKKLLGNLLSQPKLTRNNFAQYETTFLALNLSLFLLHMSSHKDIDEKEKQDLPLSIHPGEGVRLSAVVQDLIALASIAMKQGL